MMKKCCRHGYLSVVLLLLISIICISCQPATSTGTKSGGILKINGVMDSVVLGWPPTMTGAFDGFNCKPCLEYLMRWNEKGDMVPWLADIWSLDPTNKTYTIRLKKGIKFQDGTDFNASAAKWNIDKVLASGRSVLPKTDSIDVVDEYSLKITLAQWNNTYLFNLAALYPMVSPTAWQNAPGAKTDQERDQWAENNPVGTGPFKLVSWQKGSKQVYARNDNYWQKGKPYLDGIEINFIPDPMTAAAAFQAEEINLLYSPMIPIVQQLKGGGYEIVELKTGFGNHIQVLVPNSSSPDSPFTDVKLRQALSYAIDRQAICDSIYASYAEPVQQLAVDGNIWASLNLKGYPYNPEKAKQLVAEAGYPNGLDCKLLTLNLPDFITLSTAVQGMLAKANINAEMDVADIPRFMEVTTAPKKWESLVISGFYCPTDPCAIFQGNLVTGPYLAPGLMQIEEVKQLLVNSVQAEDMKSKEKIIHQVQEIVFDKNCLFTPMIVNYGLVVKQPYVKNDGMCIVNDGQWTPEDAKIEK